MIEDIRAQIFKSAVMPMDENETLYHEEIAETSLEVCNKITRHNSIQLNSIDIGLQ